MASGGGGEGGGGAGRKVFFFFSPAETRRACLRQRVDVFESHCRQSIHALERLAYLSPIYPCHTNQINPENEFWWRVSLKPKPKKIPS